MAGFQLAGPAADVSKILYGESRKSYQSPNAQYDNSGVPHPEAVKVQLCVYKKNNLNHIFALWKQRRRISKYSTCARAIYDTATAPLIYMYVMHPGSHTPNAHFWFGRRSPQTYQILIVMR